VTPRPKGDHGGDPGNPSAGKANLNRRLALAIDYCQPPAANHYCILLPLMPPAALLLLTLLAAAEPVPSATPPPAKLEFPQLGFRINDFEESRKASTGMPGMGWGVQLWPDGVIGLLPEVGVGVSLPTASKKTLADFVKDEKAAFAHFKYKILSEHSVSATEWQVEYLNDNNGHGDQEHSYERVLLANGKFYKAGATVESAHWPELGAKLTACVNSLEPITGPGATLPAASPAKLAFPQQGFRISPVDAASTSAKDTGALVLNDITVNSEAYAKSIEDYEAEFKTRPPDAQVKVKVDAESFPADNTWVTVFTLEAGPSKMQFYQKVILAHGQLYQASAMLDTYRFDPAYIAQLKACVDSLEIIPPSPPAQIVQNNLPSTNPTPASPSASSSSN
jgi:hypothetical protein